ncbi:MAG: ATP-binding protein [Verrucomicrobiota bacterium]
MNESDLTQLLQQSESETLDFKSQQYKYAGADASDESKSKLLKDIIAMANVRKNSPRHILIGVDEHLQPEKRVCGADATLDDADIQQFVNKKTNRPVSFLVKNIFYKALRVTVIQIESTQKWPIFVNQTYGGVKSNVIYVRRGSSTEELSPDALLELAHEEENQKEEAAKREAESRFRHKFSKFLPGFENRITLLRSRTSTQAFDNVHESRLPFRELEEFSKQAEALRLDDEFCDQLSDAVRATSSIEEFIGKGADHINEYRTNFHLIIDNLRQTVSQLTQKYAKP